MGYQSRLKAKRKSIQAEYSQLAIELSQLDALTDHRGIPSPEFMGIGQRLYSLGGAELLAQVTVENTAHDRQELQLLMSQLCDVMEMESGLKQPQVRLKIA